MKFKKIDIQDRNIINKYLLAADRVSCEFCFADIYMWKDKYNTEYCIEDEWLYIRQHSDESNVEENVVIENKKEFYYYVPMTLNKELDIKNAINNVILDDPIITVCGGDYSEETDKEPIRLTYISLDYDIDRHVFYGSIGNNYRIIGQVDLYNSKYYHMLTIETVLFEDRE
jgi:hypothetical protein